MPFFVVLVEKGLDLLVRLSYADDISVQDQRRGRHQDSSYE